MTVFIIQNTIIYTIPLLIVALGGMFAERSGVINLALEGEMIFGAFMGAVAVYGFQMSGAMADTPQLMFIIAMIIAAASVGVNVYAMRYLGTTISGALAGLGGYVYIATTAGGTAESTVAGMGFLALAIMIFGNWKPLGIALGAVMFGFLKCISVMSSQIEFLSKLDLPMYFYNIIPYFMVLVVLALTAKKSGCPKAEGIPYDKGMR